MILVTGAGGFIGSHLVEALRERGSAFRCLVRRQSFAREFPGVDVAFGDLATGEGLEPALRDVELVIHLAGVTKALHLRDFSTGNVRATENLARAIAARPVRLLHVSSLAAAGPSPDGVAVTEEMEPRPVSHYGRSKLQAEQVVRKLVPDAVIVRPPVVYGPRDSGVFQILEPISRGWAVELGRHERRLSMVYVQDLVEGLLSAAAYPQAAGRIYFLAHPQPVSWPDLAGTAARLMGRRTRVLRIPVRAAHVAAFGAECWSLFRRTPSFLSRDKVHEASCPYWICDSGRAARELGFHARTPLEKGLAATLAWYKEAGWLHY